MGLICVNYRNIGTKSACLSSFPSAILYVVPYSQRRILSGKFSLTASQKIIGIGMSQISTSFLERIKLTVATTTFLAGAIFSQAETTLSTGSGTAFDNSQPSLGLVYLIRTSGNYNDLGEVALFGSDNVVPAGWSVAEGQTLDIGTNQSLFSKLGTFFGGNGETNFQLPDMRGRTAIGTGQGDLLPNYSLGQYVGNKQVTLTEANLPSHTHDFGSGFTTSPTGQNIEHSNMQPSLALNPIISLSGQYPSRSSTIIGSEPSDIGQIGTGGQNDEPFYGEVTWIAHDQVPSGWAKAEGQLLPIGENPVLFSVLGTMYGGNGSTTFALPDLRGRAIVNAGSGSGITSRNEGSTLGNESETLSSSQMPSHSHDLPNELGETDPTGGATAQSNLQPTLAMNYIVALQGVFPSAPSAAEALGEPTSSDNSDSELTPAAIGSSNPLQASIPIFAGNYAPRGFATAEGQALPIASNTALFSLYWTDFGGTIQSGIFNLPDLHGRVPVGIGTGTGLSTISIGQEYGTETSTLAEANLPSHAHDYVVPGDYNNDGTVDAADYTVWRDNLGSVAGTLLNDTVGGVIGNDQYLLWRDNYGKSAESIASASQSVPEPHAFVLLCLGTAISRIRSVEI